MSADEARASVAAAILAIARAADQLREHRSVYERYLAERDLMASAGPVIAPALFLSQERRDVDSVIGPLFIGALTFVRLHEAQVSLAESQAAERERAAG